MDYQARIGPADSSLCLDCKLQDQTVTHVFCDAKPMLQHPWLCNGGQLRWQGTSPSLTLFPICHLFHSLFRSCLRYMPLNVGCGKHHHHISDVKPYIHYRLMRHLQIFLIVDRNFDFIACDDTIAPTLLFVNVSRIILCLSGLKALRLLQTIGTLFAIYVLKPLSRLCFWLFLLCY